MVENSYQNLLSKQRQYFNTDATKSISFRIEQLKKLQSLIENNERRITDALYQDLRKPYEEAVISEIILTIEEIKQAIKRLKKWSQKIKVRTLLPMLWPGRSEIHYEPYGCALIISPWNYPFILLMQPLIGAMSAGNCVILKPSEIASHTENLLVELIQHAFPEEYISAIKANKNQMNELLALPFDYIFFTGSHHVGRTIMMEAAKKLTPVTLELGGKSPCIIDQTANFKFAARRIGWAKTLNAGQVCVAPDYVYVHRSCKDLLIKELKRAFHHFYGHYPKNSPSYGRIINQHHFDRLLSLMKNGKRIYGGENDRNDCYIAPTLIEEVSWDDPIMQEEIFGPILPILTYDHLDEVITILKNKPKPLALYLFSKNKETHHKFLNQLSFGGGAINDCVLQITNPSLPFGGVGQSGMGYYHGKYSFETFSHKKSVYKKRFQIDFKLEYPPFNNKKLKWAKKIIELSYRWL